MPGHPVPTAGRTAGRGIALLGLAVVSLGSLAPVAAALALAWGLGLIVTLPPAFGYVRRLADLRRRLAAEWSAVDIPRPYAPAPAPPTPEVSGLYRWENHLYRSPRWPAYLARLRWLNSDRATWRDLLWLALDPVAGTAAALVVVLSAPFGVTARRRALRLHGRWTGLLLASSRRPSRTRVPRRLWLTQARLVALLGLAVLELATLAFTVVGLVPAIGLGMVFLFPPLIDRTRWLPDLRRQLAGSWAGSAIPVPYRPPPPAPRPRPDGLYEHNRQLYRTPVWPAIDRRLQHYLKDPATWRDLLWMLVDPIVGGVLLLVAVAPVGYGLWALAGPAAWQAVTGEFQPTDWRAEFAGSSLTAIPVGLALAALGLLLGPASFGCTAGGAGCCWPRPVGPSWPGGSPSSPRAAPMRPTHRSRSCGGSSGTCTTGRRPASSRWG